MDALTPQTAGDDPGARRLARWTPGLLLAYGLGLWLLGEAKVDSVRLAAVLSQLSWLAFTAVLLVATGGLVAARCPRPAVVLLGALAAGGWFGLSYGLGKDPPRVAGVAATLLMVVAMAALGRVLSWLFREASLLPPALVLAGVVDLWGVRQGVVAKVAEHSMETITKASATIPGVASTAPSAFALADLSIGPGDIAVAALVLAVALNSGFDLRRNLYWMYGLTIAGLALVMATGWLVPGLVFIGLAGIVANLGRFRYSPQERQALLVAFGLLVVGLAVATVLMAKR